MKNAPNQYFTCYVEGGAENAMICSMLFVNHLLSSLTPCRTLITPSLPLPWPATATVFCVVQHRAHDQTQGGEDVHLFVRLENENCKDRNMLSGPQFCTGTVESTEIRDYKELCLYLTPASDKTEILMSWLCCLPWGNRSSEIYGLTTASPSVVTAFYQQIVCLVAWSRRLDGRTSYYRGGDFSHHSVLKRWKNWETFRLALLQRSAV